MRFGPALLLAPCLAAVIAHAPALDNGFTNWDDPMFLLGNELTEDPLAHGVGHLLLTEKEIGYPIPLTVVAYAAQRKAFASSGRFGIDPAGFHAVSIALHALVALLVALLALRFGASWLGASLAGCVFAVHPLGVEPVAWVVGQKDLLATAFLLSALIVRAGERGTSALGSLATVSLAVLSMACKPSAVVAPALLVAVDIARGRSARQPGALVLYAIVGAIAAADTYAAIAGHDARGVSTLALLGGDSLLQAGWTYALQLRHVAWPAGLVARYFPPEGGALAVGAVAGYALGIGTVGAAWILWRRGAREAAFGIGAAAIAYLPVAGILPLPRGPADSYMYLPLALASVAVARALSRGFALTAGLERLQLIAIVALIIGLGAVATRGQATMWRDATTLWSAQADAYPDDPRAVSRVGDAYLFERQPDQAILVFDEVSREFPTFTTHLGSHGDALALTGRVDEAEAVYARFARERDTDAAREAYAWFLVKIDVTASDPDTARAALAQLGPVLAERGVNPDTVARAARRLRAYGEAALAERLDQRVADLRARN